MHPIRDVSEVRPDSVLYHSAFGFARVTVVSENGVRLAWERDGENLPEHVSSGNLIRVYAMCAQDGFFHRAMVDAERLQELLQVDPPGALELLLRDLAGPQRRQDLRDWVVGRGLMTERTFDRWWETLGPLIAEDDRFEVDGETVVLDERQEPAGAVDRLANPLLSPGRRLDLALIHRDELGEEAFRAHALRARRQAGEGPRHGRPARAAARRDPRLRPAHRRPAPSRLPRPRRPRPLRPRTSGSSRTNRLKLHALVCRTEGSTRVRLRHTGLHAEPVDPTLASPRLPRSAPPALRYPRRGAHVSCPPAWVAGRRSSLPV